MPTETDTIYLLADVSNVLSPRETFVFYWPLDNEYKADWLKGDQLLTGTLQISLSTDLTCFLLNSHDGVSLALSSLGNHGGPTLTHMIARGSPAQDTGGFCPATDQRGFPRSGPAAGLACDIGAVERQDDEPFGWLYLPLLRR